MTILIYLTFIYISIILILSVVAFASLETNDTIFYRNLKVIIIIL